MANERSPANVGCNEGLGCIEQQARAVGMYFAKDHFGDVPEVETTLPQLAALVNAAVAAERERWRAAALAGCDGTHPKYAEALRNLVAMLEAGVA